MANKFGQNEKKLKGRENKEKALVAKKEKQKELKEKAEEIYWKEGTQDSSKKAEEKMKKEEKLAKKKEREKMLILEEENLPATPSSSKNFMPTKSVYSIPKENQEETILYSASNIDDALELMTTLTSKSDTLASSVERHPERRIKAAFSAFEEKELPLLKKEYPSLRLSQLQQMLRKKFSKSPENPLNQAHVSYEATAEEVRALTQRIQETKLESFKSTQ